MSETTAEYRIKDCHQQRQFEKYSFTELDRRETRLGVVCDGAAWHDFIRYIRENKGVLEAIGEMLRRSGRRYNISNQFALLECWYNVACLYPVDAGFARNDSCSPDEFIERLERLAFELE